jgi:hypothetical protein
LDFGARTGKPILSLKTKFSGHLEIKINGGLISHPAGKPAADPIDETGQNIFGLGLGRRRVSWLGDCMAAPRRRTPSSSDCPLCPAPTPSRVAGRYGDAERHSVTWLPVALYVVTCHLARSECAHLFAQTLIVSMPCSLKLMVQRYMCMYVYSYVYVCMYVCMYVCICACRLSLGEHVWSFAQTLTSQRGDLVAMQRWRDGENEFTIE